VASRSVPVSKSDGHTSYLEDEGMELVDYLLSHPEKPVGIDTETTGLRVASEDGNADDWCIGISIATRDDEGFIWSHYYGVAHETGINIADANFDRLAEMLESRQGPLIYANVQFDVLSMETQGVRVVDRAFYDIPTMALLVNENEPQTKSLDQISARYLGNDFQKVQDPFVEKEKKTGNRTITPEQEFEYARVDAELTLMDWEVLKEEPTWKDLPVDIWESKQKLIRVLIAMRRHGVAVNTKVAATEYRKGTEAMAKVLDELGYVNMGPKALEELFLERLGLPVVRRTPKGKPSFDKFAMETYEQMLEKVHSEEATRVKEYRGWMKSTSASYKPYLDLLSSDGRLRPTFNTHRVTTGRLSCSEPNLQQISKDGGKPWNQNVKKCFVARPGFKLLSADYSQLELRLATAYADEKLLKEIFLDGRDLFTEMGQQLHMERGEAKRLTYTIQYGGGAKRVAQQFGVSISEAKKIIANFWATYPNFKRLNDFCAGRVIQQGRIRLWSGRYRTFRYSSDSYKAMNSLIQGGAADIVERVMIRAYDELESDDCRMLLQVHDALVFEVREDLEEEYKQLIKELMEDIPGALPEEAKDYFPVRWNVEVEEWGGVAA
jgi:DNA polymerase-1